MIKLIIPSLVLIYSTPIKSITNDLSAHKEEVVIVSWNLHNIFSPKDSYSPLDDSDLPIVVKQGRNKHLDRCSKLPKEYYRKRCAKRNWTTDQYQAKLNVLAKHLKSVMMKSINPVGSMNKDIKSVKFVFCFQEIENKQVLTDIKDILYKIIGTDLHSVISKKGNQRVVTGIVSNLRPLIPSQSLNIGNPKDYRYNKKIYRPILSTILVNNNYSNPIHVMCAHLPSQANSFLLRYRTINKIESLFKQQRLISNKIPIIALGDFNISREESNSLFFQNRNHYLSPIHSLGCFQCKGTHYFEGQWSWLDLGFLESSFTSSFYKQKWKLQTESFFLLRHEDLMNSKGIPITFDSKKIKGLSDHFGFSFVIKQMSR